MLITLEHNGTDQHTSESNSLKDYIEQEVGASVQIVSGHYDNDIYLYDEDEKLIHTVSTPLTKQAMDTVIFALRMADE